jgi:hypothetical protein
MLQSSQARPRPGRFAEAGAQMVKLKETSGILDRSFQGYLIKAKENGIAKDAIVEVITLLAFSAG